MHPNDRQAFSYVISLSYYPFSLPFFRAVIRMPNEKKVYSKASKEWGCDGECELKIVFCVIPSLSSTRNLYLIEVCICPLSAKCISNVFSHRTRHRLLSPNNKQPWRCLNITKVYPGMNISMLKIIRSRDRHFFNTVIPILVRHLDI